MWTHRRGQMPLLLCCWVMAGNIACASAAVHRPTVDVSLAGRVIAVAEELQSRGLIYSPVPAERRDCSGIFHRLLDQLEPRCEPFDRPEVAAYRSSRGIADWYLRQGRLILVQDALMQDDLIEPGVILFYGRQGKRYAVVDEKTVLEQTQHVGVVTAVERDDQGAVTAYALFHGRSGSKPAAITRYHVRQPRRSSYPPLGNGAQQWIAVARLCVGGCHCRP